MGRTFWELIERRVDATPDALMMVDEDMRTMTFAEFWTEAERTAAGLLGLGVRPESTISWQLPTWIESMVLTAALSRLGVVQNPILPIYRDREVSYITLQSKSELLVVPRVWSGTDYEEMATRVAQENLAVVQSFGDPDIPTGPDGTPKQTRVLVIDRALPQGDPQTLPGFPEELSPLEQPIRWLFYSSGTTAEPKGVTHTDAAVIAAAYGMAQRLELNPYDRNAMVFPFSHIGGMTWLFAGLISGCANILVEKFHPQETPEVLSREGVTLAGSGTVFHRAYVLAQKRQLHPLFPDTRAFPGGGAAKSPELVREVRELFDVPLLSGYGLTEAPILTLASMYDLQEDLENTEGKPIRGVELKIRDQDGNDLAIGESGEIWVRAPQLTRGYIQKELNAEAFDQDGYFRTGDVGSLDSNGNLIVSGRLKDIIIRKGENVSAAEVEDMIFTLGEIRDVAVIGVPDEESGERVCAIIEPSDPESDLQPEDVIMHLSQHGLAKWKLPEQIEFVSELPRNSSGKIRKDVLREKFTGSKRNL